MGRFGSRQLLLLLNGGGDDIDGGDDDNDIDGGDDAVGVCLQLNILRKTRLLRNLDFLFIVYLSSTAGIL